MPADRLRRRLADLRFPLDDDTRAEVRECVCAYVDSLKASQEPPERVLVGLKRIAADANVSPSSLPTADSRESRAHLLMDMVAWSIERYYGLQSRES
jgi:hypothetical protein